MVVSIFGCSGITGFFSSGFGSNGIAGTGGDGGNSEGTGVSPGGRGADGVCVSSGMGNKISFSIKRKGKKYPCQEDV